MRSNVVRICFAITLLTVLAIGCSNSDGDNSTPASATATSTPTDIATPTRPASAIPTRDETTTVFTPEETALLDVLLQPADLQGTWVQRNLDAPEDDGKPGICGAAAFAGQTQATATVEVEYQAQDDSATIVERLDQYPERVARDAFTYLKNSANCTEFKDPQGTTFTVTPAPVPALGDEAFAINLSFTTSTNTTLHGQVIYVRKGPLLATISYLTFGTFEATQATAIASGATAKMVAVTSDPNTATTRVAVLLDHLLALSDFPAGWQPLGSAGPADPANWVPLCGAAPFANQGEATARVSASFHSGETERADSVQQILQEFPGDVAVQAYQWQRDSATCGSWNAGGTEISVRPADMPTFGDESQSLSFSYIDAAGLPVEGVWVDVRIGNVLSTIIYTAPRGVDLVLAEHVVAASVERIKAIPAP